MAPKTKFKKEQIVDAAFEIAKTEGIDSITIRKVAEKLGSSIAPIYVNFKDVDELVQAVVKKTFSISKQILIEQKSGYPFQDIGMASLLFAKEYPVLFRDLVMKKNDHAKHNEQDMLVLVEMMKGDPELKGLSDGELMRVLLKMKVFQTGLSVMVANGQLPEDFDEEQMVQLLNSTAEDVISSAKRRAEGCIMITNERRC